MGEYTLELRELIENDTPIFDFTYPLFDAEHKSELESKIINHYYFREICCETVGRWKRMLAAKMNEIMPKYNILYDAVDRHTLRVFSNRMTDNNETLTTHNERNNTGGTKSTQTNDLTETLDLTNKLVKDDTVDITKEDTVLHKGSNTPQGRIDFVDGEIDADYVDSLTKEKVYECRGVAFGLLRIIDDSNEEFLYSPTNPAPLNNSSKGGKWVIIQDDENETLKKALSAFKEDNNE
jgi:hypothetical protein